MAQTEVWEKEYQQPQLLTKKAEPQTDLKHFLKFLRKNQGVELEGLIVLDLGSGTGRNGNYIAKLGNTVYGLELSSTAVQLAKERASRSGVSAQYQIADFGKPLSFENHSFDIAIDILSSNSLNESERSIYLKETKRVIKPGGYFFVKALCKEGDKNAKNLLQNNPGKEYDTYIHKDMGLTERVFSREDFTSTYGAYFKIVRLMKKTNYARFKGQSYKRNYWLAYLQNIEI
jgi:SAM-dependent methyltransferase